MKRILALLLLSCNATFLLASSTTADAGSPELLSRRYKLRPGDILELQYRLTSELNQTATIQPDGYVTLNVAGEVKLSGLTLPEARETILHAEDTRLKDPELNLILKEFTRPSVVVAGEVAKPGQIELKENTTALGAVMLAGGFTEAAQTGQVLIFRRVDDDMAEVRKVNLTAIRKTSDLERDLRLKPGDMIYVPRDKIAKIERYIKIINTGVYFNPLQAIQ
jgi:polysaccharide biosynthesis/export protein